MSTRTRLLTAAALVALTGLVRAHTFVEGNDDGDVGMYVLVARGWLHGVLPYTGVWEFKPPGLFAAYALALALADDASRAVALLGIAAVAITGLLLWRLVARIVADGERAGIIAAIFWICLSIENDGLLGDAELLTVPFATAALTVLAGRPATWRFAASGLLCMGAAQMKLSALPIAAVGAFAAARAGGLRVLVPFAAGFAAPAAVEAVVYAAAGQFDALWDANAGATLRRMHARIGTNADENVSVARQVRLFTPALECAPFAALRPNAWVGILGLWLAADLASLAAVGEYDHRQFIPLAAPLAALGGIGLDAVTRHLRYGRIAAATLTVATFFLHGYHEAATSARIGWLRTIAGEHDRGGSEMDRIVARLAASPLRRDGAWFLEVTPMAYDRLALAPPTRYPLTSTLLNRRLWPMLGFSGDAELRRIVEVARPRWIVARRCGPWADAAVCARLHAGIARRYVAFDTLDGGATVYRLRGAENPR